MSIVPEKAQNVNRIPLTLGKFPVAFDVFSKMGENARDIFSHWSIFQVCFPMVYTPEQKLNDSNSRSGNHGFSSSTVG